MQPITKDLVAQHGLTEEEYKKIVEIRARIIHRHRRETDETEGRRGRSQVRTT
jgi:hypothetical protein